ncbi:Uncharacterised protein [Mycobacterium tuberculosis]|nr:transcriptional regulator [Mycobacterium tuberculosis]AMC65380.1 transcriptional regulator [Mycobacterium tuberculosis variant africanum]CFS19181.1 Uncharacterised protein [Mycobacterium tuberculosis]CMT64343.1 Uncharacterised protein [Mycobacterium tuberculosis]CNV24078.1 Uncharacterised protein [Mycobacterium tuberculosis]
MAAITTPRPSRTGADTLATPGSRSATLCAQPRRHTSASARALNTAFGNTAAWVAASVWASNTLAPEPAVIGNRAPTGTVSRRPAAGSNAATQTRDVPSRRYTCTLSPVASRS